MRRIECGHRWNYRCWRPLLYRSVRARWCSRLLTFEAARLLEAMGGEVQIFDPTGLPLPDGAEESHPKVVLRRLAQWSEGMVWCSPERHGAMSGIMKARIGGSR